MRNEGYENNKDQDTDQIIKDMGGEAIFVSCDVTNNNQVSDLVAKAVEKYGRLDIMVNNAGVFTRPLPLYQLDDSDWNITMGVNGKGVWNGCQQAIRQFLKTGRWGEDSEYCLNRRACGIAQLCCLLCIEGRCCDFNQQLAGDDGRNSININAICPSQAATAINRPLLEDPEARKLLIMQC